MFQHKTSLRADVIFSDAPPASMPNIAISSQWSQAQVNSSHRFFAKWQANERRDKVRVYETSLLLRSL